MLQRCAKRRAEGGRMSDKTKHAPTMWVARGEHVSRIGSDRTICMVTGDGTTTEEDIANAALIVRAVNSFEAMREALNHVIAMSDDAYLVGHPEWDAIVNDARAALRAAENDPPTLLETAFD